MSTSLEIVISASISLLAPDLELIAIAMVAARMHMVQFKI